MPTSFDFAIVLAVLAVAAALTWRALAGVVKRRQAALEAGRVERLARADSPYAGDETQEKKDRQSYQAARSLRGVSRWTSVGLAIVCLLCVFSASATVVSTKNEGIVTSFGRPVHSLSNGFHLVAPWQEVTEMDAAIQTDSHTQSDSNTCIDVRIAHQAIACVDASIRWRIQDDSADYLFQNYRDFDNVRDSLVTRELNAALNDTFESYDPLAVDAEGNSTAPTLKSLAADVTKQMQREIGAQINVLNVIIPVLHFDSNTQGRIQALQAQIAQTRIALQAVQTAKDQAAANRVLAASVSKDPNVLVSKCLDMMNEMIAKSQVIPPDGIGCWPGDGSPLIVSTTGGKASGTPQN